VFLVGGSLWLRDQIRSRENLIAKAVVIGQNATAGQKIRKNIKRQRLAPQVTQFETSRSLFSMQEILN
jgi:hypothetical protein